MAQKNRNTFNNQKKVQQSQKPSFVSTPAPKTKKESKPAQIGKTEQWSVTILSVVALIAISVYELVINNSDMLFMAQGRSLVNNGWVLFHQLTTSPGSVIAWLGCYLTQFFYEPAIGSGILIALWCLLFFMMKKAFRINNTWSFLLLLPLACLLVSIIDTGYWMYYIKHPGYWFRETLGFIATIGIFLIGSRLHKYLIPRCIFIVIAIFAGYLAFGWYALLGAVYLLIDEWVTEKKSFRKTSIFSVITVIALIATPIIGYNRIFSEIRYEDIYMAGFPAFMADKASSLRCQIPFVLLAVIPLFLLLFSKLQNKLTPKGFWVWCYRFAYVAALLGIPHFIDKNNFDDYNYHAECRMYRAVDEQRWDDVLMESSNAEGTPTREMVIFNHIALMNKGTMGSQMFTYNNFGQMPYVRDTTFVSKLEANAQGEMVPVIDENGQTAQDTLFLRVHMVQTAGPLIYYNHAKTNFASRWCIENSVEYGYTYNETKLLLLCALVNSEWDLARKYISILKKSIYYKELAEKYEPLTVKHNIEDYHEFDYIRELYEHMGSTLDGDNGLCEMYILNYFANTMNKDSKALQELTLNYALIQKDINLFWPRFFLYAQLHQKEEMPRHYQEAAYLYGNLEHQVDITRMPFSKDIPQRYAAFQQTSQQYLRQGMSVQQVGEIMKAEFGSTFWWFYFFCRDVKSY